MSQQAAPPSPVDRTSSSPTDRLLVALAAAGPTYVLVATAQVATREGFDIRRHAVSLLSNGSLGWIQVANFVIVGLLVMAGAMGLRRVHTSGFGSVWIPRLLFGYGVGLVASGVFVADPADGFPPGTPAGTPEEVSLLLTVAVVLSWIWTTMLASRARAAPTSAPRSTTRARGRPDVAVTAAVRGHDRPTRGR